MSHWKDLVEQRLINDLQSEKPTISEFNDEDDFHEFEIPQKKPNYGYVNNFEDLLVNSKKTEKVKKVEKEKKQTEGGFHFIFENPNDSKVTKENSEQNMYSMISFDGCTFGDHCTFNLK